MQMQTFTQAIRTRIAWCGALASIVVLGCGSDRPDTATVRGVVELDGKPLSGFDNAGVLLTPKGGRMAKGVVQDDGSFELSTFGSGDGAIVGPAHVTVSATVDEPGAVTVDRGIGVRWIIPERFGGEDSGLSCDVAAGKENVFRIRLTSDGSGQVIAE